MKQSILYNISPSQVRFQDKDFWEEYLETYPPKSEQEALFLSAYKWYGNSNLTEDQYDCEEVGEEADTCALCEYYSDRCSLCPISDFDRLCNEFWENASDADDYEEFIKASRALADYIYSILREEF